MASEVGAADAETVKSKNTGPATFMNSVISEKSESTTLTINNEDNLDLEFIGDGEEGEDFEDGLSDLKNRLGGIGIRTPSPIPQIFDPSQYPPSYKEYDAKELKAIQYCKNFLKQYNHLFYTRRRLFLKPKNEFGIKKLVCSTIVPTQLPYCELLDWPNIADFVAGYLNYIKLRPPSELPETLHSPQTVLERMYGHCFEYSTVLCSMLIGAGYDAFVVSGFATREVCHRDLSYTICPLVEQDHIVFSTPMTKSICRYTIRPTRWLNSEYELRMLKKAQSAKKEEEENRRMVEERARELIEAPPADDQEGRRVHSWVMVLKGHREVEETFFIEPSTGIAHPTSFNQYLRIESLWNHLNYYVHMDETLPVSKLNLDIGDSRQWEYIFPGQDLHITLTPEEARERRTQLALQGDVCADELYLDVPMSWCLPLKISRDDFDRKYPTGKRTRRYKYAIMEDFCRYLNPDGLVRKIYVYKNLACTDISYTICHFSDRSDHLESRFFHQQTGKIIEKFHHGRDDFLREHEYFAFKSEAETSQLMIFAEGKRTDELYRREEEPNYIRSYYKNRSDRKTFKEVKFGPEGRVLESPKILMPNPRPIEYIVETFARNPSVPANSDVSKVTFSLSTDEIEIEYHVDDNNIFGSSRHFSKPPYWWDDTQVLVWSPELHSCFEANYLTKPKGEFELYQMLISLMKMEVKTREMTRMTEKELGFLRMSTIIL
ncbi:Dynein regulatory complex subunit 7, partial [Bulinus truncatus]